MIQNQKHSIHTMLILLILISSLHIFSQPDGGHGSEEMGLVVLPFYNGYGVTNPETAGLTNMFVVEFTTVSSEKVLALGEVEKLLENERVAVYKNCKSDSCMFALGHIIGARRIVWGVIRVNRNKVSVDLKYGDVINRKIINSVGADINGTIVNVSNHIPTIVSQLFKQKSGAENGSLQQTAGSDSESNQNSQIDALNSLVLKSEPEGAVVIINGVEKGVTPIVVDSLKSDHYDIVLKKDRHKIFSKTVDLRNGVKRKYLINLALKFGTLAVKSQPEGAAICLNEGAVGVTPYFCDTLLPGTYTVGLKLDAYLPHTTQVIVSRGAIDSLSIPLVSKAYIDSIDNYKKRRGRMSRRIIFGILGVGLTSAGVYTNFEVENALEKEGAAYDVYMQTHLANSEYDAYYNEKYLNAVDKTNSLVRKRNTLYVIGALFATGFVISIPF